LGSGLVPSPQNHILISVPMALAENAGKAEAAVALPRPLSSGPGAQQNFAVVEVTCNIRGAIPRSHCPSPLILGAVALVTR